MTTILDYKPMTKAEAKRRIIKAGGIQTVVFGFFNKDQDKWILTPVANPGWRRLDKVQGTRLNLSGTWLDLDASTEVFEVDDTRLMFVWRFVPGGDLLSRSVVSLVPLD
jgi:hypothetical protein